MPWGEIITGLFACVVVVLTARLDRKVNRVSADAAASREQLVNGHATNLREEGDERHAENSTKLDAIFHKVTDLEENVGRLWRRSDRHSSQIDELTHPSPYAPPTGRHRKAAP